MATEWALLGGGLIVISTGLRWPKKCWQDHLEQVEEETKAARAAG